MFLRRKIKEQRGQGLVEYAMLLGLIAIACVATVTLFGGIIDNVFYVAITEAMEGI